MRKIYFVLFFLLIFIKTVSAQKTAVPTFTLNLQQATAEQFATEIESKSGYHFYFNQTQFDSLKVTLQVTDKTLDFILKTVFANTSYHYVITDDLDVFLTKGREIRQQLASGIFSNNAPGAASNVPAADFSADQDKKAVEATTENKLYEIGIKTNDLKPGNVNLAGYIRNVKTGEGIVGASIFDPVTKTGVATDQFGYFSISLPRGKHTLNVRGLGMRDTRRQLMLYTDGKLNIEMLEQVFSLKEVKISGEKVANVRSTELGVNRLDIKSIKQVPAVFGEADVLRVVLTLPGVTSVGESTTGFNVRGGSADQNLILLNDMTIYNPAHFFGFFSAFDPDMVKEIELYKSSIPEKFGGRLSSVLDVSEREGNKKDYSGSAGIGLLTSRLNLEGPIVKDKLSFIFGARTTYSDWLLQLLPESYKHSSASFYDLNFNVSYQIDDKNSLYLTSYLSQDKFKLNSDTAYAYSNKNINLKWKHNYNNKLFSVFTVGNDGYQYSINSTADPINGYNLDFGIHQTNAKLDFTYYINSKNTIDFGVSSIYYDLHPGTFEPDGSKSLIIPEVVPAEQALESAIYLGDKFDITPKLSISAGIRYSLYNYLGAQTVDYYAPNLPKTSLNVVDSVTYKKNQVINTYSHPEIRVSARYTINDDLSIKAGYNSLAQYLHQISNTTAISPIDIYKLSDPNIKPQYGDQVSLGLFKNFLSNVIETSVETYYKRIDNYLDYKGGATLLLNDHLEQAVINTKGKAYGIEFLLKKNEGKLNGWVTYTYSRTFLKQDDPNAGQLVNGGAWYPADYDKPNVFNFTGNYRFTHRYSLSLNTVYSTGRPITLPLAKYEYAYAERIFYSDRNAYRVPDYFRTDISINIEGNHRVHQRFHNSWTIGVYNLTGRANAYSTYFAENNGTIAGYQLSIFAAPIPFINYNVRF